MAPIAASFLAVHVIFPLALALLGLSVTMLLRGAGGMAAGISRAGAFVFSVTYILYETIIGTVTALLVRSAAGLPSAQQAVIGDAVYRNFTDPIFGFVSHASMLGPLGLLLFFCAVVGLERSRLREADGRELEAEPIILSRRVQE